MIRIGRFELHSVVTGTFRLDGGAMFGVVPKVLWAKKTAPDEQNRITLAMRTLVAVDPQERQVVLVDTGAGHKWPTDEAERFAIVVDRGAIGRALEPYGLTEDNVTDVVVTHLHFDHNGGLTEWADASTGSTRLRFPTARHWVHRRHWEHARSPNPRDRASFLDRDLEALKPPGVLTLLDGDPPVPPFEGLRWRLSHGHTPYQLLPVFTGPEGALFFCGDMIPTSAHLPLAWVMAYDLEPVRTVAEKEAVLRECSEQGLLLAFPHDPHCGGAKVAMEDDKPVVRSRLDL